MADHDPGPERDEESGNGRDGGDAEAAGSVEEREDLARDDDDLFEGG